METMATRAKELGKLGCQWVLLKGGHVKDDAEMSVDYLYEANTGRTTTFSSAENRYEAHPRDRVHARELDRGVVGARV